MEDNNQNNVQQTQVDVNQTQDARMIHPEIIGELRKNKIGKPVVVIELFLLFGIVFAGLPFINSQLNDENSKLYQIVHGKSSVVKQNVTTQAKGEFEDGSVNTILNSSVKLKYKNIVISNVRLYKENDISGVKCSIYSYNGEINLDEQDVYFELSNASGEKVAQFKLTGIIDRAEQDVEFTSSKFNYNSNIGYQGKIAFMTDDDYPDDFKIAGYVPDENGIASITCTKNSRVLKYEFKNNYLSRIDDSMKIYKNDDNYLNYKKELEEKVTKLGISISDCTEEEDGLLFKATINYPSLPENYKVAVNDYDYYPYNTLAKKIVYAQTSKGYDCK